VESKLNKWARHNNEAPVNASASLQAPHRAR
jgi:hypothetical protein